ncbi:11-oxo-beta-amyrin 30-oxidase [Artemisia annua]|uniref:11-oxo-beta-amyrin 30-oxidase n=1 Tax=Artemisia annua TaxID=35608 RepID=A0A2U1P544_ARTAN|nr:11-oxo-beta-amyrin 30-oxidase [Artemisia annua]
MDTITNVVAISIAIAIVLCLWNLVNLVWVTPKRLEKHLRNQGFKGNKYKLLFGDMKELSMTFRQSKSKHINIDNEDEVLPHIVAFTHQSLQKHGRNFITWMGWRPRVTFMDPELIKEVLTKINDFQKPRSNPLGRLLATGVVTYEGDKWIKHRKIINPAFHVEKLKMMIPAFHLSCIEMVGKWEKMVSSKESCELDVWPHLQALTSDVISRTAFGSSYQEGIRIFELIREQGVYAMEAFQSLYIPGSRFLPTKRNMKMKAIDKQIRHSIGSIIDNRLKAMKAGEGNYDDLLGIMLESNIKEVEQHQNKSHGMTINEVIEECKLFYFAGQETTSSLLVWTMILLSKHQEWQSRAREEVLNVLGDNNIDLDGLNHLKVVNMIFHEVLRLYPPVVGLARKVDKDITLGRFSLPSGVLIGVPIMPIHYDEELWGSDAMKFNPDRFSEGISKATKNRVIYFPFGWGPRICVGQNFALLEAKIALAMILQRFSFELSPSYVHAPNVVLTLQPQYGAHLILHKLE